MTRRGGLSQNPPVSIIERVLSADRAAKILSSGLCFAIADLALKLGIHAIWGQYGEWDFRAGSLIGFFGAAVLGMVLGIPAALAEGGRVFTLALTIVTLVYDAFAYVAYADSGHLPRPTTLFALFTSADAAFVARGLGFGALASLGYGLGAARLERRLRTRLAAPGVRAADFATILLFALLGVGTIVAGEGPVYYGIIQPTVHLAAGRVQESPDPFPAEANVHSHAHHNHDHEHQRHEHGFVPDETPEPFPADGIPRPVASMRLQYQGLLGVEAFQPIEDTAYPYCRKEDAEAALAHPHDVVVLDLAGLSRAAFDRALAKLGTIDRKKVAFERVYAVSDDPGIARRALVTGIPPVVSRRYVPNAPNLPSPPFVPRLPSIAESLGHFGVRTALFTTAPAFVGRERFELSNLGFDERVYASDREASPAARDLEILSRLGAFLDPRANAPRFAFVELASFAGEDGPDTRVIAAIEALVRGRAKTSFVITSGHAKEEGEYQVPFAVFSDRLEEGARLGARLGSTYDVPQTVLGLLGSPRRFCHQGRNLVGTAEPFPSRRVVLSQLADGSHRLLLTEARHDGEELLRWEIDTTNPFAEETPVVLYDLVADPSRKADVFSRRDPDWPQIDEFWKSHLAIGSYLLRTNRFVPPTDLAPRVTPRKVVSGESVRFARVDELPAEPGRYLVRAEAFDRGATLDTVLANHRRGSTVAIDLRAKRFESLASLEQWLGKHEASIDAIILDDLGAAAARAERSEKPVGVWITLPMGDQGVLFDQIAQAGIDFVVMPIPTETGVRRAKQRGLEVWVPKSGLELLSDVEPNVVFE